VERIDNEDYFDYYELINNNNDFLKDSTSKVESKSGCPAPPKLDSLSTKWKCTEDNGGDKDLDLVLGKVDVSVGTTCSLRMESQCGTDGNWTETELDIWDGNFPFVPSARMGGADRLRPLQAPEEGIRGHMGDGAVHGQPFPLDEGVVDCYGRVCIKQMLTSSEYECCPRKDDYPEFCPNFKNLCSHPYPGMNSLMAEYCTETCFCEKHPHATCCVTECDGLRSLYPDYLSARQCADYSSEYVAENCIDGDPRTFCAAPAECPNPWFSLQFRTKGHVKKVQLFTAEDWVTLQVRVASSLPLSPALPTSQGQLLGTYDGPGGEIEVSSDEAIIGKYVIVQTQNNTALNFSEVGAFGLRKDTRDCLCEGNYWMLDDATRMSTSQRDSSIPVLVDREVAGMGEDKSSDWQGKGWYRFSPAVFGSEGTILQSPLTPGFCHTENPGWLADDHIPSVEDGPQSRVLCFADSPSDCGKTDIIKVLNCDDFFLYYLDDVPSDTQGRYCAS